MTRLQRRAKSARRRILRDATALETDLLRRMRVRQPAHAALFDQQVRIGSYLCDFVAAPLRLIVEIDGAQHETPANLLHDARRDAALVALGYHVLRFANREARDDPVAVLDRIGQVVEERLLLPLADPDLPAHRPGKPRPRPARR